MFGFWSDKGIAVRRLTERHLGLGRDKGQVHRFFCSMSSMEQYCPSEEALIVGACRTRRSLLPLDLPGLWGRACVCQSRFSALDENKITQRRSDGDRWALYGCAGLWGGGCRQNKPFYTEAPL
uniref:Uncharacterized protein n=1 Tax=Knipowitschia caucasica TaxID=637954 RepID=A0AAV2JHV0_KNICA